MEVKRVLVEYQFVFSIMGEEAYVIRNVPVYLAAHAGSFAVCPKWLSKIGKKIAEDTTCNTSFIVKNSAFKCFALLERVYQ